MPFGAVTSKVLSRFLLALYNLNIEPQQHLYLSKVLLYSCLYHNGVLVEVLIVDMSLRMVPSRETVTCGRGTPIAVRDGAVVNILRLVVTANIMCSGVVAVQISLCRSSVITGRCLAFVGWLMTVDVFTIQDN